MRLRNNSLGRNEHGFTLPEVLTVIAILGILITIGVIVLLGIIERRRVDAATNQLTADLRLAHSSATNQLTDWRVVLVPEKAKQSEGPDYYMVKLASPYPTTPPSAAVEIERTPHYFPGKVKIVNLAGELDAGGETRTIEFNTNGTMKFYGAVSGSTCVTVDNNPENRVVGLSATSRVKVKPGDC